jgi:hypothetical protein
MPDPKIEEQMNLKPVNLVWAKLEILLGLTVAVAGVVFLRDHTNDVMAGTLVVMGLFLAAAGHRSHIYSSLNRQTQFIVDRYGRDREPK